MTLHDEPPVVDLAEMLVDEEEAAPAATGHQWLLVVAGGVVGIAGLLALLVATTPVLLDVVDVIAELTRTANSL